LFLNKPQAELEGPGAVLQTLESRMIKKAPSKADDTRRKRSRSLRTQSKTDEDVSKLARARHGKPGTGRRDAEEDYQGTKQGPK
jgi:hypothetical protein